MFLVYQITNIINGKTYIGAHATHDVNDGYMGSGFLIRNAIKKHGVQNFVKTILHECASIDEMYTKERDIVTPEFVARRDTYNVKVGGLGCSQHSLEVLQKISRNCKKAMTPERRAQIAQQMQGTQKPLRCCSIGDTFGRWIVESRSHRSSSGHTYVWCVCECGTRKAIDASSLVTGLSTSCGCRQEYRKNHSAILRAYYTQRKINQCAPSNIT
jgi:hypothetical protein